MMASDARHYDVLQNDKYGRYLVANKDLESAELIFTDMPFAVGPKPGNFNVKLGYLLMNFECDRAKPQ